MSCSAYKVFGETPEKGKELCEGTKPFARVDESQYPAALGYRVGGQKPDTTAGYGPSSGAGAGSAGGAICCWASSARAAWSAS